MGRRLNQDEKPGDSKRGQGYCSWLGGAQRLAIYELGLAVMVACGCGAGSVSPPEEPTSMWHSIFRSSPSATERKVHRGILFALRMDGPMDRSQWVRCPLEVAYRFERIPSSAKRIDITDLDTLERFFPVDHAELRSHVQAGRVVRVDYEVVGRFVLEHPSPRAAAIVCPGATHHVRSIAVGAYRLAVDGARSPNGGVSSGDRQTQTHGRPGWCKTERSDSPSEACAVPLAYELSQIPGHDPKAKLAVEAVAGPDHRPSADTMPGARDRRGRPTEAGFEDCFAGFEPTGQAGEDLGDLMSRCGVPTGMVPHSEVLTGWQAATGEVSRYGVQFEAGACYRAFGVGGGGVGDLDMGWHDPSGRLVARDVRPDAWAVVPPVGPYCAQETGSFELVVSVERGQGTFAVQVWRVGR